MLEKQTKKNDIHKKTNGIFIKDSQKKRKKERNDEK